MKVLVACEHTGMVRDCFLASGHVAVSCDLLPTTRPGPHLQGDVLQFLGKGWDLLIAHPPCTYLANSGVRWLQEDAFRWTQMFDACKFFLELLNAPIERIAIENPVMHKHAMEHIKVKPTQIIQPWMFGHGETKATCLWLKNLPALRATHDSPGREARIHKMSPGKDRWAQRSATYAGIAIAMAEQWGSLE